MRILGMAVGPAGATPARVRAWVRNRTRRSHRVGGLNKRGSGAGAKSQLQGAYWGPKYKEHPM